MPRKKKPAKEIRNVALKCAVSREEYARIQAIAEADGLTVSSFVRQALLQRVRTPRETQIRWLAYQTGRPIEEMRKALDELDYERLGLKPRDIQELLHTGEQLDLFEGNGQ